MTGQRLVTRWRAMRAVSSGLAGPDGLVGRCARKCKIQLDTTRLSITATFYRQRSGRGGCVFIPLYVCMYVCALVFVLFFFVTREMIYLAETIFIRYLMPAKV